MTAEALGDAIFRAAANRDMRAATAIMRDGLREGRSVTELLAALASAQAQVGAHWYSDEWSVADEHAATAIVDAALAVVEASVGPVSPSRSPLSVVVACPEGEWHALPARMLATELRSLEVEVIFLGSSMPADHLARYVSGYGSDLVALSVSTALSFGATARAIDAVRAVGVPVVVGGGALDASGSRARALGADGWGADAAGVLDGAGSGPTEDASRAVECRQARQQVVFRLELDRPSLVEAAMDELSDRIPAMARFDERQLAHTRQDLEYMARFAEAAILVDDAALFVEYVEWLGPLLVARGVPAGSLEASLDALHRSSTDDDLLAVLQTGIDATQS